MSVPVIEVNGLSKAYPIYASPYNLLMELITGRKRHDEFWALKDVSFSIQEGQRLGIIGQNGSGKSTLLKIITGHLQPSTGSVAVHGKISAMLSLNTVLNPEETGINNIRFNLLLNGCPKSKINDLAEDVIDFTELGSFIYAPVKTYSSGMNAKLAFAITTAIDPEILVIDEVLSVGDAYFAGKATQRMKELCDRGKALVLVSHSDAAIRMMCDTVLWMENGSIRMFGPVDYVLARYEEDYRRVEDELTRTKHREKRGRIDGELGLLDINEDVCLLRLVAKNGKNHFEDTHYIRQIMIELSDSQLFEVPLFTNLASIEEGDTPANLDVFGSEWGRVFSYKNIECRMLGPRTGRSKGGHIFVKERHCAKGMHILVEALSLRGSEQLIIEYADLALAKWIPLSNMSVKQLKDGWNSYSGYLEYSIPHDNYHQYLQIIEDKNKPDIEITKVSLRSDNGERSVLKEREQFQIVVQTMARRPTPICDVGIKITRADGVYCFWQSSGQAGCNLLDLVGPTEVVFCFEENPFGAGEYSISAYIANGWNYPNNYPYEEVFDRKVSVLTFNVLREFDGLDFGCINIRASVEVHSLETDK